MFIYLKFRTELSQSSQVMRNFQGFFSVDLDMRDQLEEKGEHVKLGGSKLSI